MPSKTKAKKEFAWNYGQARKAGLDAHKKVFLDAQCSPGCMQAQLDAYHKQCGVTDRSTLRTDDPGLPDWQTKSDASVINKMKADLGGSSAGSGALS